MTATALSTDLYELTMAAGHVAAGRHERVMATFELFVRALPPRRNFLVAAGVETVLDYVERLRFDDEQIAWLTAAPELRAVPRAFFEYLRAFRFSGEIRAVGEGTPVFANEPILQVTAPLAQAQIIETTVLSLVNFQTSVASKAVRVALAARGRPVMEFGARRAHGPDAALLASHAAYLAGCASTSFVEAGRRFGIPLSGTMAHAWVQAGKSEAAAFREYAALFGEDSTLLIDTYDTEAAARAIVASGLRPAAVRLDSGDLLALSRSVRAILDSGGLTQTRIVASGDLDEFRIRDLLASGAPIDAFGVGTTVVTSIDAPALGGVYKLVELTEQGVSRRVLKTSTGKATWPGRKQVWRVVERGLAAHDIIALDRETPLRHADPLLHPVMRRGMRIGERVSPTMARAQCLAGVAALHDELRGIDAARQYAVEISSGLRDAIASDASAVRR